MSLTHKERMRVWKERGFAPEHGVHEQYREKAISFALENGVAKAAEEFGVGKTTIYNWINAEKGQ